MKTLFRLCHVASCMLAVQLSFSQTIPTLTKFQSIEVLQKSTFAGEMKLDSGLTIKGLGNFLDSVRVAQGLSVEKTLKVLGLPENIDGTGLSGVLVKRVDGFVEYITFDNLSKLIPGIDDPLPCATDSTGNIVKQPATWKYNGDIIYTNECTPDVKVGIGVTAPIEKLEVAGNARLSGYIRAGRNVATGARNQFLGSIDVGRVSEYISLGHDGHHSYLENRAPAGGDPNNADLHINYSTGNGVIIGGNTDIPKTSFLKVGGNTSVRDRLMVGSTNDTAKAMLHIKAPGELNYFLVEKEGKELFKINKYGTTFARDIIVMMDDFPDYVFKKDYKLETLREVKAHIEKYGRLPKMPSAQQVASEGAQLGELTRLLVEKVEELTLYTLQLEENAKKQEERIQQLEKSVQLKAGK